MSSVYVLASVGESPSVLSELLWWLCVQERRAIAGIEAWATGRGAERVQRLLGGPAGAALIAATGPLPDLQPLGTPPEASHGFRVHCFTLGDRVLDDVRSRDEAAAVSAELHDRIRTLRAELPERIEILGCLAGGRKTVSAALQTAFCLQAGPTDRLVHVIIDATLDQWLRDHDRVGEYAFPEARWAEATGVPVEDQVVVHEVPFPRLRWLVPRRLSEVLQRLSWQDVWPVLEANMGRDARGRVSRQGRTGWRYAVYDAATEQELFAATLTSRTGALLVAMAAAGEGATAADLAAWLDAHELGWAPPRGRGDDAETRANAIRGAANALRTALQDLPVGLERFAPRVGELTLYGVEITWDAGGS